MRRAGDTSRPDRVELTPGPTPLGSELALQAAYAGSGGPEDPEPPSWPTSANSSRK